MRYILTTGWEDGIADLTQRLVRDLSAGKKVLWLLSGGSNAPASVEIMGSISSTLRKNLSVMLVDERYGAPGHADSNATKLKAAGFTSSRAHYIDVLQPQTSFQETVSRYKTLTEKAFAENEIIIAQLGMGDDGHIAGILPNSPACTETNQLVFGYETEEFDRITMTFPALKRLTSAYVLVFGPSKRTALQRLRRKRLDPLTQPAQILKQIQEAYVYNDQIGG